MLKHNCRFPILAVFFLLIGLCVPAISNGQQFTRITPKWASDNPGRLEMSNGSAFNGSDGFTFRLLTDHPRRFSVLTRVSYRETEKRLRPLVETHVTMNGLKKWVVMTIAVWPSENLDVSLYVSEAKPVFKNGKFKDFIQTNEYELRLSDFVNEAGQVAKLPNVDFSAIKKEAEAAVEKQP
jgi:hypothetical protein